jgi:hypothetical protein
MGNSNFKLEIWGMYAENNPIVILYLDTILELDIAIKLFKKCYHMPHEIKTYQYENNQWFCLNI